MFRSIVEVASGGSSSRSYLNTIVVDVCGMILLERSRRFLSQMLRNRRRLSSDHVLDNIFYE